MDKKGEIRLSESDLRMMKARTFVIGRLSAGEATFEEVVDAATAHLGISTGTARGAIWILADAGLVDGVTSEKLSLPVPEAPAPAPTTIPSIKTVL